MRKDTERETKRGMRKDTARATKRGMRKDTARETKRGMRKDTARETKREMRKDTAGEMMRGMRKDTARETRHDDEGNERICKTHSEAWCIPEMMSFKVTAWLVALTVVLVGTVTASPQPINVSASVRSAMLGSKAAAESKVTGPDGVTRGQCVYNKDGYPVKVTYQETASGNVTAQSNSTSSEDVIMELKMCREEVETINQKVAVATAEMEKASDEFADKFSAINQQMEKSMQELDQAYQKVKKEPDMNEAWTLAPLAVTEAVTEFPQ
ncbi:hypothetical protein Pcinc_041429 [Petrolisthes cinctipes]|uniref:Uncharacterized protein n=1 Tax=Petrolisthes cinctipes TaxID=88211 RepID=A0AAE1BK71_PETCI|nr:hypothetical protein Pcinc_041429 [Petrolisthes cinctipes]